MEVSEWVGKVVKVELLNGQYYKGTVEKYDDNFLLLIDINGNVVSLNDKSIMFIKEVGR